MERIVGLLPTGTWVTLDEWDADHATYDGDGWLDQWAERVGGGCAPLPSGGRVDLGKFLAVKAGTYIPLLPA